MGLPKIIEDVRELKSSAITVSDESEILDGSLPINADTLGGFPASYFASKAEVNLAISNYVSTILGQSY